MYVTWADKKSAFIFLDVKAFLWAYSLLIFMDYFDLFFSNYTLFAIVLQ